MTESPARPEAAVQPSETEPDRRPQHRDRRPLDEFGFEMPPPDRPWHRPEPGWWQGHHNNST